MTAETGREMRMEWSTDSGAVVVTFPSNLTNNDIDDISELFALTVSGMKRRASLSTATKEATDHAR